MTLRSARERIIQTIAFEGIGIAIVSPFYASIVGQTAIASFAMITLLSIAILIWSPVYNTLFDFLDWHIRARVACKRSHGLRVFHAIMHEVSAVLLTCPILIWVGGHSLGAALSLNFGLTVFYSVYTYLFHVAYDRLRPVGLFKENSNQDTAKEQANIP